MKSAYDHGTVVPLSGICTRPRQIALFMVTWAPAIVKGLMVINTFTAGGSKVIINVVGNT